MSRSNQHRDRGLSISENANLFLLLALAPSCVRTPCPSGQVQDAFDECVAIQCGADEWRVVEESGATMYVDVHSPAGGDGSQGAPLQSVQTGIDMLGYSGGTVLVAAGVYEERFTIVPTEQLHIVGRCADLTTLRSPSEDVAPTLSVNAGEGIVHLENLTVESGREAVLIQTGMVELSEVRLYPGGTGIHVVGEDAGLILRDSEITGAGNGVAGGGVGVFVDSAAATEILRVVISESKGEGLVVDSTEVSIMDLLVEDTSFAEGNPLGGAAIRLEAAEVILNEVTVRGFDLAGLLLFDADVTAQGLIIDQFRTVETPGVGVGLYARSPPTDTRCGGTHSSCLQANELDVRSVHGWGIEVFNGFAHFENANVQDVVGLGLGVGSWGSLTGSGLVVEGTSPWDSEDLNGSGLFVYGGQAVVDDSVFIGNTFAGVEVRAGGQVNLSRVESSGNRPTAEGFAGQGVYIQGGSTLVGTDLVLRDNHTNGLQLSDDSIGVVERVEVGGTIPREPEDLGAVGVYGGSSLDATGLSVVSNYSTIGLRVFDAEVNAQALTILDMSGIGVHVMDSDLVIAGAEIGRIERLAGWESGIGVAVDSSEDDTTVFLGDVLIHDIQGIGLFVNDSVPSGRGGEPGLVNVEFSGLSVQNVEPASDLRSAHGVVVQGFTELHGEGLVARDNDGPGLVVSSNSQSTCDSCEFLNNMYSGIIVADGTLELSNSVIGPTRLHPGFGGGFGLYIMPAGTNRIYVEQSSIEGPSAAVIADVTYRTPAGDLIELVDNQIMTSPLSGVRVPPGVGVLVHGAAQLHDGAQGAGLLVQGNTFLGDQGIPLLLSQASATLSDNSWPSTNYNAVQVNCLEDTEIDGTDVGSVDGLWICPSPTPFLIALPSYSIYFTDPFLEQ